MKAKVKNQFYRCDEFKTSQNITLPLFSLLEIAEYSLMHVKQHHYYCKNLDNLNLDNVFIKICQPCIEERLVEFDIWEED